jgi:hypothetical protein
MWVGEMIDGIADESLQLLLLLYLTYILPLLCIQIYFLSTYYFYLGLSSTIARSCASIESVSTRMVAPTTTILRRRDE